MIYYVPGTFVPIEYTGTIAFAEHIRFYNDTYSGWSVSDMLESGMNQIDELYENVQQISNDIQQLGESIEATKSTIGTLATIEDLNNLRSSFDDYLRRDEVPEIPDIITKYDLENYITIEEYNDVLRRVDNLESQVMQLEGLLNQIHLVTERQLDDLIANPEDINQDGLYLSFDDEEIFGGD